MFLRLAPVSTVISFPFVALQNRVDRIQETECSGDCQLTILYCLSATEQRGGDLSHEFRWIIPIRQLNFNNSSLMRTRRNSLQCNPL